MRTFAIIFFVVRVAVGCGTAQIKDSLKFDIRAVDKTADPCMDFYQYACGGWLQRNRIPPDQAYSAVFQQMQQLNEDRITQLLQNAVASGSSPLQHKIGDYYASCMDEDTIEAKSLASLKSELGRIDAITDLRQFAAAVARLHGFGSDALFALSADQRLEDATQVIAYLDQSGLNLPERADYISPDPQMAKERAAYQAHLDRIFHLIGSTDAHAADDVLRIETALAVAELSPVQRRDRKAWYHLMTTGQLQALVPDFPWSPYFSAVDFRPAGQINVAVLPYFEAIARLLKNTSIGSWKNYLRWELVRVATTALPTQFREAEFDFYQHQLGGVQQPLSRAKQCTDLTNRDLGEAVGELYAKRYFGPSAKEKVLSMVERIRQAFRHDIAQSTWMGTTTKREALRKLDLLRVMIGYPHYWRDYSHFEVQRGDALGNAFRGRQFEFRRQIKKIGKPVDREEFYELVQGVEGYHDNPLNVVVFTAGILQPPFFDPAIDDAVNFGLAGAVIGHEMSHAFDDKGHLFDGKGNMRDWWRPADADNYYRRAACFVRQYSQYPVIDDLKINGDLTLGENIADNGGLQLAHIAFEEYPHEHREIDGHTEEQRFFLGWAQWRCMNITAQKARELVRTDPHSPGRWRVNGVVSNMPVFAKAFSCKRGDAMVRPDPCRIW